MTEREWDLFIAHASEDKAAIAEPLAMKLSELGLSVWYDEFEIRVGMSLSEAIDLGLSKSSRGVVVLSHSFFGKPWTSRELRGLVSREIGGSSYVLPIWHGVGFDDVLAFSPPLADLRALSTSRMSLDRIVFEVADAARPDIIQGLKDAGHLFEDSDPEMVKISELAGGPILHRMMSQELRTRIAIISRVFSEILPFTVEETIENFSRDQHPETEVESWEAMAAVYLKFLPYLRSREEKRLIFGILLDASQHPDYERGDIARLPAEVSESLEGEISVSLRSRSVKALRFRSDQTP